MRALPAALALALVAAGCLGLSTTGLDATLENETDTVLEGTLTLKRGNDTVVERAFTIAAHSVLKLDDLTRVDGRYVLNVTLADGRTQEAPIHAGASYGTPQVKLGVREILIFQKSDIPPRSL